MADGVYGRAGYTNNVWTTGDVITQDKMRNMDTQWERAASWATWDVAASSASFSNCTPTVCVWVQAGKQLATDYLRPSTGGAKITVLGTTIDGAAFPTSNLSAAGNVVAGQTTIEPSGAVGNAVAYFYCKRSGSYRIKYYTFDGKANGFDIYRNNADYGTDLADAAASAWSATVDVSCAIGDIFDIRPKTEAVGGSGGILLIMNSDGSLF